MRTLTPHRIGKVIASGIAVTAALAFALFMLRPALLAQGGTEHWVGTRATAEVGRPQTLPAPIPGPAPFMASQCPPGPPPAATLMNFTNQTLRQIVHTSIGGSRIRIVLSNTYSTAPLTIGAAHEKDPRCQCECDPVRQAEEHSLPLRHPGLV